MTHANPWVVTQQSTNGSTVDEWDVWIVGLHGGAGESRVASLCPEWRASEGALVPRDGRMTLYVARSDWRGLDAAEAVGRRLSRDRVSRERVLGLVVSADAPGRRPRPLRDRQRIVEGLFPSSWWLGWIEAWRYVSDGELPPEGVTVAKSVNAELKTRRQI